MNELTALVRRWFAITIFVTTLVSVLLLCLCSWIVFRLADESRSHVTSLLTSNMARELPRISEERLLHLDSIEARQQAFQSIVEDSGKLTLTLADPGDPRCQSTGWSHFGNTSVYPLELRFDELPLGCLIAKMEWSDRFATYSIAAVGSWIGLGIALLAVAWMLAFRLFRSRVLEPMLLNMRENERHLAIATMTAMLAHDVRKPFSILKIGMNMIDGAKDHTSVKHVVKRLVPELDKALANVEGLITDVMEIGSPTGDLARDPASPRGLIASALAEAFRYYPKSAVDIAYSLLHTSMVCVDQLKIARVFSNIIGNALQATRYQGQVWFKTRDVVVQGQPFTEFCIGNAGSFISEETIPKLFDAFYTSGKRGGTGLGLAIAQKVVNAHGGLIWCESEQPAKGQEGQVEFKFTLPSLNEPDYSGTAALPNHSSHFFRDFANLVTGQDSPAVGYAKNEASLVDQTQEMRLKGQSSGAGSRMEIALLEDNAFLIEEWQVLLGAEAVVHGASSVELFLEMVEKDPGLIDRLDCIVTDYYFEHSSLTGKDVGMFVKKKRPGLPILLASDGTFLVAELAPLIDFVLTKDEVNLFTLTAKIAEFRAT